MIAVLTCAACSGWDSEQAGGVPPPSEVGECHNTPESYLNTALYNDSAVVECSQPHTLQTLKVIDTDEEITPELLGQLAAYCHAQAVAEYIDSPGAGADNLLYLIVSGPTPEQQEAGQSWIRCEAGHQAATRLVGCCKPLATTTESLEGAMGNDIARFQQCVAEVPDPKRRQPLVARKEPHRGELLLIWMELEASEYPSAAKLESRAVAVPETGRRPR